MLLAKITSSRIYLGLTVGVLAVSFAAIFIRLADAPALVIASYRLSIAAAVMLALATGAWLRSDFKPAFLVTAKDVPLLAFSSLSLALHFWTWVLSLEHTSVASSVVLVTTSPFLVAVASRFLFHEPLERHTLLGIAVGISGGAVLALGDAGSGNQLWGDLLAFAGAVAIVGYILAGRRLRRHVPALTYNAAVYSGAAVLLLVATVVARQPFTGYSAQTYTMFALLALVPQVVGHSLLNWSLAHVTGTVVAIVVMAEPVLATAAAVPILGEAPPWTSVLGGVLILAGIYVAVRPRGNATSRIQAISS